MNKRISRISAVMLGAVIMAGTAGTIVSPVFAEDSAEKGAEETTVSTDTETDVSKDPKASDSAKNSEKTDAKEDTEKNESSDNQKTSDEKEEKKDSTATEEDKSDADKKSSDSGTKTTVDSDTAKKNNAATKVRVLKKTADDHDVEVGQSVGYTVTSLMPSTEGHSEYVIKITDTMPSGLSYNKDAEVTIGNKQYKNAVDIEETEEGYTISIDAARLNGESGKGVMGQEIKITYSATVTNKAVAKGAEGVANTVKAEYPDDSAKDSVGSISATDKVYTAEIVIDKYAEQKDKDDHSKKLAGAQFVLATADGKFFELVDGKVTWVEAKDADTYAAQKGATIATTDANGKAEFEGVQAGADGEKYIIYEVKAPSGYSRASKGKEVTLKRTSSTDGSKTAITGEGVEIGNAAATEVRPVPNTCVK